MMQSDNDILASVSENIHGHKRKLLLFLDRIEKLRTELGKERGALRIIDIGCGNGTQVSSPLGRIGYSVVGVDVHEPSVSFARAHTKGDNVTFLCVDICDMMSTLSVPLFSFDVVILSDILEHVPNPQQLLSEAATLLRPDGIVLISIPNGYGPFEIENFVVRTFWPLAAFLRAGARIKRWLSGNSIGQSDSAKAIPYNHESGHIQFFSWKRIHSLIATVGLSPRYFQKGCLLGGPLTAPLLGASPLLMRWNIAVSSRLPLFLTSVWYFECGLDVRSLALKEEVRRYWDAQACGTGGAHVRGMAKYSREYFDAVERQRYIAEPEIFSFAQFPRYYGEKVLEVGIGAATDFLQWVRSGAQAYGIDLTAEAVNHAKHRLAVYGLNAKDIRIADAEALPYDTATFDLVYSWGVLHHCPNPKKALEEVVRVCRPGGTGKIMVYNRHSIVAYVLWFRHALLRGRPWKSLAWCIYHSMESIGTKAYTSFEINRMLAHVPVTDVSVAPVVTYYDRFDRNEWKHRIIRPVVRSLIWILPASWAGWFWLIEFRKKQQ